MTTITTPACLVCGKTSQVEVTEAQASDLATGALTQDVLPDMPRARREVLITGTHPGCWKSYFG
jgi:hypothetical protein